MKLLNELLKKIFLKKSTRIINESVNKIQDYDAFRSREVGSQEALLARILEIEGSTLPGPKSVDFIEDHQFITIPICKDHSVTIYISESTLEKLMSRNPILSDLKICPF